MKNIQPITSWYNGVEKQATILSVVANSDDLCNSAYFYYQLLSILENNDFEQIASGVLNMTGEEYQNWQTNDYAYDWVANKLNLIITGEYVPTIA